MAYLRPALLRLSACCTLMLFLLAPAAHAIGPKGDVFLGFSRLGTNTFYPNAGGLNGLEGTAHLKLRRFIGIEADVAHYGYGSSSDVPRTTTVMFGPRVTIGALGVRAYAHALIGGEHSSNSSGVNGVNIDAGAFSYALGGGVDVPVFPFFAWRVNGDYIAAPTLSTQDAVKGRISTGLVFRF